MPYKEMEQLLEGCRTSFCVSQVPSTPMWTGFTSKIRIDHSKRQIVDYLPQINSLPTSYSIVHETMIQALKIADECHQEHIIVTYYLAIAKMALQIQLTEKPKFDALFVNLGAFHIEIAYFKALGKYIDSSGIVDLLGQSETLAQGSTNGFIDGKHFNVNNCIHYYQRHFIVYISTKNSS